MSVPDVILLRGTYWEMCQVEQAKWIEDELVRMMDMNTKKFTYIYEKVGPVFKCSCKAGVELTSQMLLSDRSIFRNLSDRGRNPVLCTARVLLGFFTMLLPGRSNMYTY